MIWVRSFSVAIVLAGSAGAAMAFEETKAPEVVTVPPAATGAPASGAGLSTDGSTDLGVAEGEGTEVKIPGLGSVGVLPKLDFGLELLYGATDKDPTDSEPVDQELLLKGRLKHTF